MTAVSAAAASAQIISFSDERASIRRRLLQSSAREVGEKAFARAGDYDEDGAYPVTDVAPSMNWACLRQSYPLNGEERGYRGSP